MAGPGRSPSVAMMGLEATSGMDSERIGSSLVRITWR
jgi:hypothetical protein